MKGDKLESVAFQFCKVATVALIAGKYVLPVAAGLASALFFAAWLNGKRETRCIGRHPLLIAIFWALVCVGWVWLIASGRHLLWLP